MNLPVEGRITQTFNTPVDYIKGRTKHEAVDIVTNGSQPIKMIAPCVVVNVINKYDYYPNSGFGNELWVEYDNGDEDRFCHCAKDSIKPIGTKLNIGDVATMTGQTGYRNPITTWHTHWERYKAGKRIDPLDPNNQPPTNNQNNITKKPMKLLENRKCVWIKAEGQDSAEYWVIRKNEQEPYETRHKVKKDIQDVATLFGSYGKLSRVDWPAIAGLTEKGDFDLRNLSITHPELFESL